MPMSNETIEKLQSLAALELDESERQALREHLDRMLHWVSELPPLTPPEAAIPGDPTDLDGSHSSSAARRALRDDVVQNSLSRSAVLRNAPDHRDGCYRVPPLEDRDA